MEVLEQLLELQALQKPLVDQLKARLLEQLERYHCDELQACGVEGELLVLEVVPELVARSMSSSAMIPTKVVLQLLRH
jgi:hypothetical protein